MWMPAFCAASRMLSPLSHTTSRSSTVRTIWSGRTRRAASWIRSSVVAIGLRFPVAAAGLRFPVAAFGLCLAVAAKEGPRALGGRHDGVPAREDLDGTEVAHLATGVALDA